MDQLLTIDRVPLDDPDIAAMIDEVQHEYVLRYGSPDVTPLTVAEFSWPHGVLFRAVSGGRAVGMGGWRAHDLTSAAAGLLPGDAEIKRMYVRPPALRRGVARQILARIEASARGAGRTRLVLETGTAQPEAIALYSSSGYRLLIPKFGHYRHEDASVCMVKDLT